MRGINFEPARILETDGWNATTLHLYSHCGTHMDAPPHFGQPGETIDQIGLEKCMGPAWLVDLSRIEPQTVITVSHLGDVTHKFKPGESLLIRTDWSRYINEPRYRNELPRISLQLAQWCVDNKVLMLGVEPPSVADVNNPAELTSVHKTLFTGGVIVVEGLTNLDAINKDKVTFMAFPLKIADGDGSPVRAMAIEDI